MQIPLGIAPHEVLQISCAAQYPMERYFNVKYLYSAFQVSLVHSCENVMNKITQNILKQFVLLYFSHECLYLQTSNLKSTVMGYHTQAQLYMVMM